MAHLPKQPLEPVPLMPEPPLRQPDPPASHLEAVTPERLAAAKQAQAIERAVFTAETGVAIDDDGRLALLIGNAIAAAVYGPRGERREHR